MEIPDIQNPSIEIQLANNYDDYKLSSQAVYNKIIVLPDLVKGSPIKLGFEKYHIQNILIIKSSIVIKRVWG